MVLTNRAKGYLKAAGYTCYMAYEVHDELRGVWRESGFPVRDSEIEEKRALLADRTARGCIRNSEFHVL